MYRATTDVLLWAARVLWAFLRFQPLITILTICCLAGAQLGRVLSFFIPLKIIVIAASDKLPRVLEDLVGDDGRLALITTLTVFAVIAVLSTFILEGIAHILSKKGAVVVLEKANKMALASRERTESPRHYARFCTSAAQFAFFGAGALVLLILNPLLALVVIVLLIAEFIITAGIFTRSNRLLPHSFARWIEDSLGDYLEINASVIVVFGFLTLLAPFVFGRGGEILIALLSFLLLRQSLNGLKKGIKLLVQLARNRPQIDPLVFHDRQLPVSIEAQHAAPLRATFHHEARQHLAEEFFADKRTGDHNISVTWRDPLVGGVYLFDIIVRDAEPAADEAYQLRVFPVRSVALLQHEDFLFQHIERSRLLAPSEAGRGEKEGFDYQFCSTGSGNIPATQNWSSLLTDLLVALWSVEPPRKLVRAYLSSRALLQGRLTSEFVERMAIAIDTEAEDAETLKQLIDALPTLREILSSVPLAIYNPDIGLAHCRMFDDGSVRHMTWWRWGIEPVGYGIPRNLDDQQLEHICEQVKQRRTIKAEHFGSNQIRLITHCQDLEAAVRREAYTAALKTALRVNECLTHIQKPGLTSAEQGDLA